MFQGICIISPCSSLLLISTNMLRVCLYDIYVNLSDTVRRHLDKCNGIDLDLQDYLRWIENGYRYHCRIETKGYFRLKKSLEDVTTLVSRRLDEEDAKGSANLVKATKERLSKKRKKTHSILESVGSL